MNHHHRDLRRRFSGYQPTEVGPRGNPPNKDSGGVRDSEVRIRGSLEVHLGRSATDPAVIDALVRKARAAGVVVFLKGELERMPDMARAVIEGEHKRICQRGRG